MPGVPRIELPFTLLPLFCKALFMCFVRNTIYIYILYIYIYIYKYTYNITTRAQLNNGINCAK